MTVDVLSTIEINRPPDVVSTYARDPDNVPKWYAKIQSVEWRTPPPLELGSRIAFVAHFLGRRLAYTYEVVDLSPTRFVMRTAEGPFPMETTYTWEDTPTGGTVMGLRNRGEPSGFSRLVAPFMSMAIRLATQKDLALLKSLTESP